MTTVLPDAYSLDALRNSFASFALSPLNLFGNFSFSPEALLPLLQATPQIPTFSLTELPAKLLDSFNAPSLESPVLYSEQKGREGLKRTDPFALDPALSASLPLLADPEILFFSQPGPLPLDASPSEDNQTPHLSGKPVPSRNLIPSVHPQLNPPSSLKAPVPSEARPTSKKHTPQLTSHTPWNWDALRSRYAEGDKKEEEKKRRPFSVSRKRRLAEKTL